MGGCPDLHPSKPRRGGSDLVKEGDDALLQINLRSLIFIASGRDE